MVIFITSVRRNRLGSSQTRDLVQHKCDFYVWHGKILSWHGHVLPWHGPEIIGHAWTWCMMYSNIGCTKTYPSRQNVLERGILWGWNDKNIFFSNWRREKYFHPEVVASLIPTSDDKEVFTNYARSCQWHAGLYSCKKEKTHCYHF